MVYSIEVILKNTLGVLLIKKLVGLILALYFVATGTFLIMKAIPGDPFSQEQAVPEEILLSMYAHYGLDQPLHTQYFRYMKGIVTFNFGPSFKYEGRSVSDVISAGFPISASLGLISLLFALTFGIIAGILGAIYRTRWQDKTLLLFILIGMSVPSFILSTFLQYFLALKMGLLPIARWGTFAHMILPALSLASFPTAFIARLTRNSAIEVLEQEYIKTAIAKGLPRRKILFSHVLKNSLLPVISYISSLSASILTGSFVIEKIYGIPGLGSWLVSSITNRDYTMIIGITTFYCVILLISVFCADLIYMLIDPRVRSKMLRSP